MIEITMSEGENLEIKAHNGLIKLVCVEGHISIFERVEFKNCPKYKKIFKVEKN